MLIDDILRISCSPSESHIISETCFDFLKESNGYPLFKNLPRNYDDLHRVKVRLRKKKDVVAESFNEAFKQIRSQFQQRAVFADSHKPQPTDIAEPFYIFPLNGYKFMYNTEVSNSSKEYKNAFNTVFEQLGEKEEATHVLTDLLKYTYKSEDLKEGIKHGAEIVIYNIPYYYAVRCSKFKDYGELLTLLQ